MFWFYQENGGFQHIIIIQIIVPMIFLLHYLKNCGKLRKTQSTAMIGNIAKLDRSREGLPSTASAPRLDPLSSPVSSG